MQAKRASAVRAKVNLHEDIREDIRERAQECSRSFGEQFAKFFLHCTVRDPLVCAIGGSVVVFGKNRVLKLCVVANY